MDKLLIKKINLLVRLATIDGHFAKAEKDLLAEVLQRAHLDEAYMEEHKAAYVSLEEMSTLPDKPELLYWVLKMILADGVLHPSEVKYAKRIANQLGYREEVIDHFVTHPMESLERFDENVRPFQL